MKLKDGFLLRPLGDAFVVVPVGQASIDLRGMISLNGSGAFLWKALQEEQTEESLVQALTQTYDVDETIATDDVRKFTALLRQHDLLCETEETA